MIRAVGLALLFGVLWTEVASGHELPMTSAKVTLRPGHLAIEFRVDMLPSLSSKVPPHLCRSTHELATMSDDELVPILDAYKRWLNEAIEVRVDSKRVLLTNLRIPEPAAIRRMARKRSMVMLTRSHDHPARSVLRAEVLVEKLPGPVSLALPVTWGQAQVTFAYPVIRLAGPKEAVVHRFHSSK